MRKPLKDGVSIAKAGRWDRSSALLLALLLFAFRLTTVGPVPKGFYCDEASILYNGWSIAETGRDEHGVSFPVAFEAFGDFKSGPFIYLVAASTKLFGITPFAARFPSAVLLLAAQLLGFFFLERFVSSRAGLYFVGLVGTEHWFHHFSHVAFQLVVEPLFLGAILYGSFATIETGRMRWATFTAAAILLAWWSYPPAHLFVPLATAATLWFLRSELFALPNRRNLALVFFPLAFTGAALLALWVVYHPNYLMRSQSISIFKGQGYQLTEAYRALTAPDSWTVGWNREGMPFRLAVILHIYLIYLDPHFLFVGTGNNHVYGSPDFGWYGPAMGVGLVGALVRLVRCRESLPRLLLCWILLAPLPAALTWMNHPHQARAMLMQPAVDLLAAIGLWEISSWRGRWRFASALILSSAVAAQLRYFYRYSEHFSKEFTNFSAPMFQFEFQELFLYLQQHGGEYSKVVFIPRGLYYEPYIFALLYTKQPPAEWLERQKLPWNLETSTALPSGDQLDRRALYVVPYPSTNMPAEFELVYAIPWSPLPGDRIALFRVKGAPKHLAQ